MKTIQIPSVGKTGGGCVRVPRLCKVKIEISRPGLFFRSPDGDDFSPMLPNGQIDEAKTYVCSAPPYDVRVTWRFTPLDPSQEAVIGAIQVDEDGVCTDTKPAPPCEDPRL